MSILFPVILNVFCMAIAAFLIWLYYKWDNHWQYLLTLLSCGIYQITFDEIHLVSNKIILSLIFGGILWQLVNLKCKIITASYKKERLSEAMKTLEAYKRQQEYKRNIRKK